MDGEIMQRTLQGADAPAQESFEELIAGRCREDFTRKVQQIIDRRFAEHRVKEENWSKWIPAMEKLCEDRGLDREDAEGLTKLLNSLAGEKDRREGLREWAACQALRGWMEEAAALGERYPNFDLQAAMEGEGFMEMLCKGLGVQQAWELCNRDELMLSAMAATAAHVRELTARKMEQRQGRPREAGLLMRSAAVTRPSMKEASREVREELERRAMRGERIVM